jgi:hypothetical protein
LEKGSNKQRHIVDQSREPGPTTSSVQDQVTRRWILRTVVPPSQRCQRLPTSQVETARLGHHGASPKIWGRQQQLALPPSMKSLCSPESPNRPCLYWRCYPQVPLLFASDFLVGADSPHIHDRDFFSLLAAGCQMLIEKQPAAIFRAHRGQATKILALVPVEMVSPRPPTPSSIMDDTDPVSSSPAGQGESQ